MTMPIVGGRYVRPERAEIERARLAGATFESDPVAVEDQPAKPAKGGKGHRRTQAEIKAEKAAAEKAAAEQAAAEQAAAEQAAAEQDSGEDEQPVPTLADLIAEGSDDEGEPA